jgi:AcrR family transcriptional regulator
MRRKGVKKEETRLKMLEAARTGFSSHGYSGIGVDGLAKAAGVTSGAFYSHFGSKDAAFAAALATGLDQVIEAVPRYQREHGQDWVKAFGEYYLGRSHRGDPGCGCPMAALTSEVARSSPEFHTTYEKKMKQIANLAADGLAGTSDEDRRARAWAMLSVLIGGLNVARAVKSTKAADEIADAVKTAAIKAAGRTRGTAPDRP